MTNTDQWLVQQEEVREMLGICQSSLFKLRKQSGFPRPFKLGGRWTWRKQDIIAWVDTQAGSNA